MATPLSPREASELAARYGLRRLGARPALGSYIKALWRRRSFIRFLASSDAMGRNQGSYLGQLWAVLNPLLEFCVYFVMFGLLLSMDKGTGDFTSYLVIGTFLFSFIASSLTKGAKAISSRLSLVRALEFPRAVLPISLTLTELIMMWPALAVMLLVLIIRGQPITWHWLGLIPCLCLMYLFALGGTFMLARICSVTPDYANLVPIAMMLLRFTSGVFYNIAQMAEGYPKLAWFLEHQPFGIYLKLARGCTMQDPTPTPGLPVTTFHNEPYEWGMGLGWAALFGILGFLYFWRAEARYGRD